MNGLSEELQMKLGAYVDGALEPDDRKEVEALSAADPAVAAEIQALTALNRNITAAFDLLLGDPKDAPQEEPDPITAPTPANDNRPPFLAMAASLVLGAFLGAGFLWSALPVPAPVEIATRSWLGEVAEYHQVYARQTRHLVEVPAAEKDHIEQWLSKEIGVAVHVPDLAPAGWTFQGARLLVAAGKPVAQLLYTNTDGEVIALCALQNDAGEKAPVATRSFGDVHMAVWKTQTGSFAIVGDNPTQLPALANLVAPLI